MKTNTMVLLEFLGDGFMQNMNKAKLLKKTNKQIVLEEFDLNSKVCENLREDIDNIIARYGAFETENLKLNVKILKNLNVVISFECVIDKFLTKSNL